MSYSIYHAWSLVCCLHIKIFCHSWQQQVLKIFDIDLRENHLQYNSEEWHERLNESSWMLKDLTRWSENCSWKHAWSWRDQCYDHLTWQWDEQCWDCKHSIRLHLQRSI